jgi:hypothetical protein
VWLARLLSELKDADVEVPVLRVDNKSTISLVRNPVHHDRSKHIDIRYHLIQEYEQTGQIAVDLSGRGTIGRHSHQAPVQDQVPEALQQDWPEDLLSRVHQGLGGELLE